DGAQGRGIADRVRRAPEDPSAQSRIERPAAGHRDNPLGELDLERGRGRTPRACVLSCATPGVVAPAHLHSPNATRTILSNKGGSTVVEGERCTAERGDLILTPNGTWHDHGNDSSEPVIWIDMLDWPLMEFLDAAG